MARKVCVEVIYTKSFSVQIIKVPVDPPAQRPPR